MNDSGPNLICVCPVKDEAFQLDRFLSAASMWAAHIILADQGSTDDTRQVAARYPKVRVIDNPCPKYDERSRQRLLLQAAREFSSPRVIIALDADELLTANVLKHPEWLEAIHSKPGTALMLDWVNLQPDGRTAWIARTGLPWGFVDDGTQHNGSAIHSPRVPFPEGCPRFTLQSVKVLHYQYTDWSLMKRKQMFYQCWEAVHTPGARPGDIYRKYHHMDAVDHSTLVKVREEWFAAYESAGIDVRSVKRQTTDKWDHRILDLLLEYGPERFAKLDVWSVDWPARLRELKPEQRERANFVADPRSPLDRAMLAVHRTVQPKSQSAMSSRVIRKLSKTVGW
jgi:hypothetical protein